MFELYFDDLTTETQKDLMKIAGIKDPKENNWDVLPIATVVIESEVE